MIALDGTPRLVLTIDTPTTDETFRALGTDVRLIATGAGARVAVARARAEILEYHARLSRFLPASEISALNADPRPVVPASALLRSAVHAGLWAARHSGGLVDPCLLDALGAAGYERSFEPRAPVPPPSGPPRSARADPASRWHAVSVDDRAGAIRRPPGGASTWVAREKATWPTSSSSTSLRCASGRSTAAVTSVSAAPA
jgi:hypothetical protein